MSTTTERIQYLTKKAQRGVISQPEQEELARLVGRNPGEFRNDDGLTQLITIALVAIAIAFFADMLAKKN